MKILILMSIGLLIVVTNVFPQCPKDGLKIESAACEAPKNLMVGVDSCQSVHLQWRRNKNQSYVLTVITTDPATSNIIEEERVVDNACDDNGNCEATVTAGEGFSLSWSVQAICSMEGAFFYSAKVNGPAAYLPLCEQNISIGKPDALHVYPNPASNYLNVTFDGKATAGIEFRIFDINGKMVYSKPGDPSMKKQNNQYKLDLRNLTAGTYMLEVYNGTMVSKAKFVLLRN